MGQDKTASFEEILEFAVRKEQEAADLYKDFARRARRPGAGAMFLDLSKQEMGHKAKLQKIARGRVQGGASGKVTDLRISDHLAEPEISGESSYQDILILAIKREEASVRLYTDMGNAAPDEASRDLLAALAAEEKKHKLSLESEYDTSVLKDN